MSELPNIKVWLLVPCAMLVACAGNGDAIPDSQTVTAETPSVTGDQIPSSAVGSAETDSDDDSINEDDGDDQPLLDRTQDTVFSVVNNSSQWFDGFFGSAEVDQGSTVSRGRLTLGGEWDQRNGFDGVARIKARIPLPAMRNRMRFFVGRGDANEFVDGSNSDEVDSLPTQFNDFEDDDWLLGVGYSRNGLLSKGFDFGVGVKLSTPLEPYVQSTYRWNHSFNDAWLWQLRPRVFLQSQRGAGASLNSILDFAANGNWLLRSWVVLLGEEEVKGLGWSNNLIAYQKVSEKTAMSYSIYANGETDDEVELHDYGAEVRYRRRIWREWFYIELSASVGWPQDFSYETRERNLGAGIQFEMQFGEWSGQTRARPQK